MSGKRQKTKWTLLVFAGLLVLTGWVALLSRPQQIVFSNGSWITIRRVSYGRDCVYYHEPLVRLMAMNRFTEESWRWLNTRVPAIRKRFTGVRSMVQSRTPTLVVFGDANINADRVGFWEFVSVDSDGRESEPMETELLDHYERYAGDKPKIGPAILAMRKNVMNEPRSVRVYEVNRKEGTRLLLTTLGVSRGMNAEPESADSRTAPTPFPPDPEVTPADSSGAPRVVAVFPEEGAQSVEPVTVLRIRFDQPMSPLSLKLNWRAGGFIQCGDSSYDEARYEFAIPVELAEGTAQQIAVNDAFPGGALRPREGFHEPGGRSAAFHVWAFRTAGTGPSKTARVVKPHSITPAPGSRVPLLTWVEIQFNEPMAPPEKVVPYVSGEDPVKIQLQGPSLVSFVECDPQHERFKVPLVFKPGGRARFTIQGFKTAAGEPVAPIELEYEPGSEERAESDLTRSGQEAEDPRLVELLRTLDEKRRELTSVSERVQNITLRRGRGVFVSLGCQEAQFIRQPPDRYYADISGIMGTYNFRVGSDGSNWWWHYQTAKTNRLIVCPISEMQEVEVSFGNPLGVATRSAENPPARQGLRLGAMGAGGNYVISKWQVERVDSFVHASRTEWWIDPASYRPTEVRQYLDGSMVRSRYLYNSVDRPIPPEAFRPPDMATTPMGELGEGYTNRYVQIMDGSNGRMSVRWGKRGPKGSSSSGLN